MSSNGFQIRFEIYARSQGMDPQAVLDRDSEAFPGGCMAPFMGWIREGVSQFRATHPEAFAGDNISDQDAFTEFLRARVTV